MQAESRTPMKATRTPAWYGLLAIAPSLTRSEFKSALSQPVVISLLVRVSCPRTLWPAVNAQLDSYLPRGYYDTVVVRDRGSILSRHDMPRMALLVLVLSALEYLES